MKMNRKDFFLALGAIAAAAIFPGSEPGRVKLPTGTPFIILEDAVGVITVIFGGVEYPIERVDFA
jgi:hypothetical protein